MNAVATRAAILAGASLVSRLLLFAGLAIVARHVGADAFGVLSAVTALGTAAFVLSEWGLDLVATRAYARRPPSLARTFWSTARLRVVTACLAFAAFVGTGAAADVGDVGLLAAIVGAYVVSALAKSWRVPFVAAGRVGVEAAVGSCERVVAFAAIVVGLAVLDGTRAYALGLAIGAVLAGALSFALVRRAWPPVGGGDRRRWPRLLGAATPIGLNQLAVWVYYRANLLLVQGWLGDRAAGVLGAITLVPMAAGVAAQGIVASLVPRLATIGTANAADARAVVLLVRYAGQAALCGAVLASLAAPRLVDLLFGGGYEAGVDALRVLSFHVFFLVTTPLLATLLRLNGAQWRMVRYAVAGAATSLAAGAMLVPYAGILGAAIATLLGETVVFTLCLRRVQAMLAAPSFARETRLRLPAAGGALACAAGVLSPAAQAVLAPLLVACVATTWRASEVATTLRHLDGPSAP